MIEATNINDLGLIRDTAKPMAKQARRAANIITDMF